MALCSSVEMTNGMFKRCRHIRKHTQTHTYTRTHDTSAAHMHKAIQTTSREKGWFTNRSKVDKDSVSQLFILWGRLYCFFWEQKKKRKQNNSEDHRKTSGSKWVNWKRRGHASRWHGDSHALNTFGNRSYNLWAPRLPLEQPPLILLCEFVKINRVFLFCKCCRPVKCASFVDPLFVDFAVLLQCSAPQLGSPVRNTTTPTQQPTPLSPGS